MEEVKSKTTGGLTRRCLKCAHEVAVEEGSPTEQVAS
jgi:hypothetical protein